MHMMLCHVVHLHGAEGPESDMQGDIADIDTFCPDLLQQLRREMQACRRRSCAAFIFCINRLIAVLILQVMGDIRRQRHLAKAVKHFLENTLIMELHQPVSVLHDLENRCGQTSVAERHLRAGLQLFAGPHQRLPDIARAALEKENFDRGTLFCGCVRCLRISGRLRRITPAARQGFPGFFAQNFRSQEPRRNDLRIVQNQRLARLKIFDDVTENPMLDVEGGCRLSLIFCGAFRSVQHHQTR